MALNLQIYAKRVITPFGDLFMVMRQNNIILISLLLLSVLVVGYRLYLLSDAQWIGSPDSSSNAHVAANLLSGKGYTINYIQGYFQKNLEIVHPEDIWPLLMPTIVSFFYIMFGESTTTALLVNTVIHWLIVASIYYLGRKWFNTHVAWIAACLALFNAALIGGSMWCLADLGNALMVLWGIHFITLTLRQNSFKSALLAALFFGLALNQKYQSLYLVALLVPILLLSGYFNKNLRAVFPKTLTFLLVVFLIWTPFLIRNYIAFDQILPPGVMPDLENMYNIAPYSGYSSGGVDAGTINQLVIYPLKRLYETIASFVNGALLNISEAIFFIIGMVMYVRTKEWKLPLLLAGLVGGDMLLLCWTIKIEMRYLLWAVPPLLIFSAYGIHSIVTAILRTNGIRVANTVLLILVGLNVYLGLIHYGWYLHAYEPTNEMRAAHWIKEHVGDNEIVMSRNVWQMSYYSGHLGISLPNTSTDNIVATSNKYGAKIFVADFGNENRLGFTELVQGTKDHKLILLGKPGSIPVYRLVSASQ